MKVTVQLCVFKRKSKSPWENGVSIDDDKVIVDEAGRVVPSPIHDFYNHAQFGYIILDGDPATVANKGKLK